MSSVKQFPEMAQRVKHSFEQITPALAENYLASRGPNRNINENRVQEFVRIILTGAWDPHTAESIKFDQDGRLIDGQQGATCTLLKFLDTEDFPTIDGIETLDWSSAK